MAPGCRPGRAAGVTVLRLAPERHLLAQCAGCGDPVFPASARVVVIDGAVVMRCVPCATGQRPVAVPVEIEVEGSAGVRGSWWRRKARAVCAAGASGAIVLALGISVPGSVDPPRDSGDRVVAALGAPALDRSVLARDVIAREPPLARPAPPPTPPRRLAVEVELAVAPAPGQAVAVDESELFEWVHPVVGTEERGPFSHSREFGADRPGIRPPECGAGHCGVDLDGPRGTPIVAVDGGEIASIQRGDGDRGGKWVRVRHETGVVSAYMHLDDVPEHIQVGVKVQRGEWIGVLGTTGIRASKPHLHFSVEIPENGGMRYLDPGPSLRVAQVIDLLDMIVPEP